MASGARSLSASSPEIRLGVNAERAGEAVEASTAANAPLAEMARGALSPSASLVKMPRESNGRTGMAGNVWFAQNCNSNMGT